MTELGTLHLMPHGPEPSWFHVLECPGGSAELCLNSNFRSSVSDRVLLEPPAAWHLRPDCDPMRVQISPKSQLPPARPQ
jgi:hypothetical protein